MSQKMMHIPVVHIHPQVDPSLAAQLKDIVTSHRGTVTDQQDSATHVVYPDGQFSDGQLEGERERRVTVDGEGGGGGGGH